MMSNIEKRQSTELVKYSKEQFIKQFAPRKCMVELAHLNSVELAIKSGLNSIAKYSEVYGREFMIGYLQLWIIDLNEFLSLTRRMTDQQIEDTAELIYHDNTSLNLADVNLVFTNAKKGIYGQLYGNLDGSKILNWFTTYSNHRADVFFEKQLHEHQVLKNEKSNELHGLEKVLKLYGRMEVNSNGQKLCYVWDYANNVGRLQKDMTEEMTKASEKAKWENFKK